MSLTDIIIVTHKNC